jgi:hypothetical protein
MSISTEDDPLALMHNRRVSITAGRLLIVDDTNLNCSVILVRRCTSMKRSKVKVTRVRLSWALLILPLLHHVIVLVEACVSILNNESVLQLN